jgi:hypothetical protein
MIRTAMRLGAVASASVIIFALEPATVPASTPAASVQFVRQAQLQTTGALVTLSYECFSNAVGGSVGTVRVRLQQASASGSKSSTVTCDDQKHQLSLDVLGPFKGGTALAEAALNGATVSAVTTQAELRLR